MSRLHKGNSLQIIDVWQNQLQKCFRHSFLALVLWRKRCISDKWEGHWCSMRHTQKRPLLLAMSGVKTQIQRCAIFLLSCNFYFTWTFLFSANIKISLLTTGISDPGCSISSLAIPSSISWICRFDQLACNALLSKCCLFDNCFPLHEFQKSLNVSLKVITSSVSWWNQERNLVRKRSKTFKVFKVKIT